MHVLCIHILDTGFRDIFFNIPAQFLFLQAVFENNRKFLALLLACSLVLSVGLYGMAGHKLILFPILKERAEQKMTP